MKTPQPITYLLWALVLTYGTAHNFPLSKPKPTSSNHPSKKQPIKKSSLPIALATALVGSASLYLAIAKTKTPKDQKETIHPYTHPSSPSSPTQSAP
ncbi:MAG: hypothetical protein AAF380_00380 [Bacteroidota bacterium]